MKKLPDEIMAMVELAHTGDWLAVRSTGAYALGIRFMLSHGRHKCWTNHNAPVWRNPISGQARMLQIQPPQAYVACLSKYLTDLYAKGGRAILLRPDVYACPKKRETTLFAQTQAWLREEWLALEGIEYDTPSIKNIAKLYFRLAKHVPENDKTKIYCTEGTFLPYWHSNPHMKWKPDELMHEKFPAPIHGEHIIRQERAVFIAGNNELYERIRAA